MSPTLERKIIEITNTAILSVHPKDPVKKAKELFQSSEINILPVLVANQFLGVVYRNGFKSMKQVQFIMDRNYDVTVDLDNMPVDAFVDKKIKSLTIDSKIKDALEFFVSNRQYFIPILDEANFIGIVTPFDVFRYLLSDETTINS